MPKPGKRYEQAASQVEPEREYQPEEAVALAKKSCSRQIRRNRRIAP